MRVTRWLTGFLIVILVAGCGGKHQGDVSGTVRFKDTPLTSGSVKFVGSDGKPAFSAIGPDGGFSVHGLATGTARISVISHPRVPGGMGGSTKATTIPERYKEPDTSELTFEVVRGQQIHDIDLAP
jgi:hypothetical protein